MAKKYLKQFKLTKEQLNKNLDIFGKTQEKYKPFTEELLVYLNDNGFFTCPASINLSMHNCFEGGLLDHLIRVGKYCVELNKILPDDLKQEISSIIKVVFLHSIGKAGLYEENDSQWHVQNLGQYYKYKEDQDVAMRVGEKSAYLAMKYDVELTEEEYQGIINSYKNMEEDSQAKYYSDVLSIILRQGIQLAMLEEKNIFNNFQNK